MGLGSLRQGAKKVSQNSNTGKGGKGGFFNKLRIPKLTPNLQGMLRPNENPGDPIMLCKPETLYDDVYDIDDHGNSKGTKTEGLHTVTHQIQTNGKKRFDDFVCTAGPNPHAPQPCVGCATVDSGNKSVGNGRQQWAFNVKHLIPYHEVPLVDFKTKQIRMRKDKPNEPMMGLEACRAGSPSERLYNMEVKKSNTCEHCQNRIPVLYGAPKVYVLGKNHLEELFKVDNHLEQTCANCMTRLIKVAYACTRCGEDLLDVAQSGFINDQLKAYAETPQQCRCGNVGLPKAVYDCGYDPNGMYKVPNGCPESVEPKPLSIFDCVFYVHKEGEDTQSKLIISPPIPVQHFRTPTGQPDLANWLKAPHLSRSFSLQDMFKPISLDEQAKICNVPNPYAAQQPQYGQYPGQPQQPQGPAPQYGAPPQQYQQPAPQPQFPQQQQFAPQAPNPYAPQPVPGFPPQQPQWGQPQQGTPPSPPGAPFSGHPNFNKP